MSEIYKDEIVTETITHTKRIQIGIKCDICGKEIKSKYWSLTRYHGDWGNDSCDSYERFDVCSRDCINKKMDEYIEDCIGSNTQAFELEQEIWIDCKSER